MPSAPAMQRRDANALERLAVDAAATLQAIRLADAAGDAGRVRAMLAQLLEDLQDLREHTDAAIDRTVGIARGMKMSWQVIADPLGISRQAAQARFHGPRLTPPGEPPTRTREPRRTRGAQK